MRLDAAVAAETEWKVALDGCGDRSSGGALAHAGRGGEEDDHR
jgi:hypothetical protein